VTKVMVTFWEPGSERDYRTGHITNISASGVFITTVAPIAPPATVDLRLILGEEEIDIMGEVIRTLGETHFFKQDSGAGMGVRFVDPGSEAVRTMMEFLT